MKKWLYVVVFCSWAMHVYADKGPEQLDTGTKFLSPDRKFVVVYNPDQLEIRNSKTGHMEASITVSLLYALRWTGDSKSFVAVEHLVGGSGTTIVHFNGARWENFIVDPPGEEWKDSAVVKLKAEREFIEISYKVRGSAIYFISFTVNPSTRALSNVRKEEISFEKWKTLRMVGDKQK
jgi:hypothetical protein